MSDSSSSNPFSELYGDLSDRLQGDRWQPDSDVFETAEQVIVHVELAGVASEGLKVSLDGSAVRISGVREIDPGVPVERLHQMEIASGPFDRRIQIPVAFHKDQVSAHLANGFLTVTLKKRGRKEVVVESE